MLIGHAAAAYLGDNINAGDVVALGWGRTLKFAIAELTRRTAQQTTVVSMLGGLAHALPLNPTESAWDLAEKIGADCYLLPVPVYADLPEQRDAFMSQRSVQDVVLRARRANMAVLSVGSIEQREPDRQLRLHQAERVRGTRRPPARSATCLCHFVDADGRVGRP